jgi:hypothetical protein
MTLRIPLMRVRTRLSGTSDNRHLHLLKVHLPYHESDHVLNFAYNAICNGTCLQDIELRRTDENFLDALGTRRIVVTKRRFVPCAFASAFTTTQRGTDHVPARYQNPANSRCDSCVSSHSRTASASNASLSRWSTGLVERP